MPHGQDRMSPWRQLAPLLVSLFACITIVLMTSTSIPHSWQAQSGTSPIITVPRQIKGGSQLTLEGAASVDLSLDRGLTWQALDVSAGVVTVPAANSFAAQLRVRDLRGSVRASNPFALDSEAPASRIIGRPFITNDRVMVDHEVIGHDVATVRMEFRARDGSVTTSAELNPDAARTGGFDAPADGAYDLRLIATDTVGNIETKSAWAIEGYALDRAKPELSISVDATLPYLIAGDILKVTYSASDVNLDPTSLRLRAIGDGTLVGQTMLPANASQGTIEWEVPGVSVASMELQLQALDMAGNATTQSTRKFVVFAGSPQVFISNESIKQTNELEFTLTYTQKAALDALLATAGADYNYTIEIFEALFNDANQTFEWQTKDAARDNEFSSADRTRIRHTTQLQSRGFAARVVVGDGNNRLTERVPDASAPPESIFHEMSKRDRVRFAREDNQPLYARPGQPISFEMIHPGLLARGTVLYFEYSTDGGTTWIAINENEPEAVSNITQRSTFIWRNPPASIRNGLVRVITQNPDVPENPRMTFRVMDMLRGGITIDNEAPASRLIRLTDEYGRTLQPGDYTNSRRLRVYWQATDAGASGLKQALLWDNLESASRGQGASHIWRHMRWNNGIAQPGTEREMPLTDDFYLLDFGDQPRVIGNLGLLIEGIDFSGNRRFAEGSAAAGEAPDTSVFVDRLPPRITLTGESPPATVYAGETITLSWEARDDQPRPQVPDSLGMTPVSIILLTKSGERVVATGLPAEGTLTFPVHAIGESSVRYAVMARDRSGNSSNRGPTNTTPDIRIRETGVAVASLTSARKRISENRIVFEWAMQNGDTSDVRELKLWARARSQDVAQPEFELVQRGPVGTTFAYNVTGAVGVFEFALTAESRIGLSEPDPTDSEVRVVWDLAGPLVEAQSIPANGIIELGVTPPTVRVTVTDDQFTAEGVQIYLHKDGVPIGTISADGIKNGEPIDLDVPLSGPGEYEVVIDATDSEGNQSMPVRVPLHVVLPGTWEITSFNGGRFYRRAIGLPLTWRSNGLGAGESKIDLSFVPVMQTEGSPVYGTPVSIASGVSDIGVHVVNELPQELGQYIVRLEATRPDGERTRNETSLPFEVVDAHPALTLTANGVTEVLENGDLVLAGIQEHSFTLRVTEAMGDMAGQRTYELPARELAIRFAPFPEGTTDEAGAFDWLVIQQDVPALDSDESTNSTYQMRLSFPRDGRYRLQARFTDVLGYTAADDQGILDVVVDAGPPIVKLWGDGPVLPYYSISSLPTIRYSAEDPLLDKSSVRLQYHTRDDLTWKDFEESVGKVILMPGEEEPREFTSGTLSLSFKEFGVYYVRLVAEDALRQQGSAILGPQPVGTAIYVGEGRYVAQELMEVENASEAYTTPGTSRRAQFMVKVFPILPWPEGLRSVTLWWRPQSTTGTLMPWRASRFEKRWQVWGDDGSNAVPFEAPHSGTYEFIVTTTSMHLQDELEGALAPAVDEQPELVAWVTTTTQSLMVHALKPSDELSAEQVSMLNEHQRVIPGAVYTLNWTLSTHLDRGYIETTFTQDYSLDGGAAWAELADLAPATDGKPGLFRYTERAETNAEGDLLVRHFSCLWALPTDARRMDEPLGRIRIFSQEHSDALPPFARKGMSPAFRLGPPPRDLKPDTLVYYQECVRQGALAEQRGDYKEALRYYLLALRENNTRAVNLQLAEVYKALGDELRWRYHLDHAGDPVPDKPKAPAPASTEGLISTPEDEALEEPASAETPASE